MAKGSSYEREVCKLLSKWWTDGHTDAVFWRTSNSGGRATVRGSKGTTNQHGDICATDPVGLPLLRVFALEIKRGYPRSTIHDLIDSDGTPKGSYASWISQAKASQKLAGSKSWMILHKRDRREPTVTLPDPIFMNLLHTSGLEKPAPPFAITSYGADVLATIRLDAFLSNITPLAVAVLGK